MGLELDESMAPDNFTMDESHIDMSQSLRIEDLTAMFGHHVSCGLPDERRNSRRTSKLFPHQDLASESECWSEPDRNVSQARVGLCDTGRSDRAPASPTSDGKKSRARRAKLSYGSRSDDKQDVAIIEEVSQLGKRCELLECVRKDLCEKLEYMVDEQYQLSTENKNLKASLESERSNVSEANKNIETLKTTIRELESRVRELELRLTDTVKVNEVLKIERQELEATFVEKERALRRAADEATVQASQSALERARAQHDRLRLERELDETRDRLSTALETNSRLEIEATRRVVEPAIVKVAALEDLHSEEDRPTSPDLGIDSDRLSSLDQNDPVALSPREYLILPSVFNYI